MNYRILLLISCNPVKIKYLLEHKAGFDSIHITAFFKIPTNKL